MSRIEDMMQKMMNRFDATDENQLEQQFSQLSTTMNPHQPGTLPSNTIQNLKNDGHCMAVTTRGGKPTINSPMLSKVENYDRKRYR
ncbi:hypothetical protein R3W88_031862 [Solanum pinnatisectum]|uniref:Uncharacterized protein n=1 Tax=Solanum pinnatisectum TaxID=50273 RepID=A0AAV9LQ68_9SOLN|nr:hypothetical protein R3W88_031862 [Solanum pinnatisectum]